MDKEMMQGQKRKPLFSKEDYFKMLQQMQVGSVEGQSAMSRIREAVKARKK